MDHGVGVQLTQQLYGHMFYNQHFFLVIAMFLVYSAFYFTTNCNLVVEMKNNSLIA